LNLTGKYYILTGKTPTSKECPMSANLATTRLSSKGQVVIPEEIRNSLGLKTGVQFVVIGKGDSVIFKTISPPSFDEFDDLLSDARKQARRAGLRLSDIDKAIKRVRKNK
jgi:AbrB family looped-hinge helix DNA binding protein